MISNQTTSINEGADMEEMKIKFDGQSHQVEANTFINSLIHFTTVVHETNRELGNEKKVTINIKAQKEGSFDVLLNIVNDAANVAQNLFGVAVASYVSGLIDAVSGVYNAYKFLKGEQPKNIESVEGGVVKVENTKGDVNYFDLRIITIVQGNQIIRSSLSQGFDTLNDDPNVTGLEFYKDGQQLLNVAREEFSELASGGENATLQKGERIVKEDNAMLRIVRLSFDPKMKSDFLYLGNRIPAWVTDVVFYKEIDNGEPIRKGDVLDSVMEIKQQYDDSLQDYVNKSYKVIKINKHHLRSQQLDLHDE